MDDDPLRSWCLPGQFGGSEHDVDYNRIAKHDLGGSRTVFNYCCAKIARSGKIAGRCGIPENLSDQMTAIGTTVVDNTAITAVDQAAAHAAVAQQTIKNIINLYIYVSHLI